MKRHVVMFLSIVLFALTPLLTAAQGMPPMPATPVPADAPVGMLAEFNLRHLPTPHAEVWFLRMGLEPGGSLPMGTEVGPMILFVESGELSLEIDGPIMLPGADRAEEPDELTMTMGDSVFLTRETGVSMANAGDQRSTFLVLLMYPAMEEGEGDQPMEEPAGLSQMAISIGTAEFMDMPATVRIERVVMDPGESVGPAMSSSEMQMPGYIGMELGAVETGSAEVTLENTGMANLTWPGILENQVGEPERVPLKATVQLGTGDAYAFHGSTLTWTALGDEPLTILRVVIMPMPIQ